MPHPSERKTEIGLARWTMLLAHIRRIHSSEEELRLLEDLSRVHKPTVLAFLNAHAMNIALAPSSFYSAIRRADIVLRDGSGMLLLHRMMGIPPGRNLNGTDFIPKLIQCFEGRAIALYGTKEPYLGAAASSINHLAAAARTITLMDGFQSPDAYLQAAVKDRPALIVLGMGMPKQEDVALLLKTHLHHPCLLVCGGAIIDFMGGRTSRAPWWLRRIGGEWVYRLAQEPRRLFSRYVLGNPLFIARATLLWFGNLIGKRHLS